MKKSTKILACVVAGILLIVAGWYIGSTAKFYPEKWHIQRIEYRAEKRFLGEGSEYTGLEVYPIYNENDEMEYALIEFEPQGFLYVGISERTYPWKSMYTLNTKEPDEPWMPYRIKEGAREDVVDADGNLIYKTINREYIRDENGLVLFYYESHFKVAGIENERRYFLSTKMILEVGLGTTGLIPAVKRGDQYLDLVDGAMIDYTPGMQSTYAVAEIGFINKSYFDL